MIELELKAVVPDAAGLVARLRQAGAREALAGRLIDRRFDFDDRSLTLRDEVIRVREYRGARGERTTSLEWKGPSSAEPGGYKQREEIGTNVEDAETLVAILERIGLRVTRVIDRDIQQFTLDGATVRLEHYPRMDDLVEVEGEPDAIERAIRLTGISREQFSTDSLADFVQRYESRTGHIAATRRAESDA